MGIQTVAGLRQQGGRATGTPDWWARAHPARAAEEAELAAQAALVDRWRKHEAHGTPETLLKAGRVQQGALARLYMNGHLSIDQLAWAQEIRVVAERIGRDVAIGSLSLETRVDNGRDLTRQAFESLGRVRAEVAYTRWRARLARPAPVLAMIVEDRACRAVARAFRMRDVAARRLLIDALDAWPGCYSDAADRVDAADLAAVERMINCTPQPRRGPRSTMNGRLA